MSGKPRRLERKTRGSKRREFKPKDYQYESIKFGVSRPAAGFLLAPGLGKTMIVLTIFRLLKKWGFVDELWVFAKRRIVYETWCQEVKKWGLPFKVRIIHGSKKEERLYKRADVRLMNYEGLDWLARKQKRYFREAKKQGKRLMLAVDESSKMRNTHTLRFRSLKKILKHFVRRYIMTGSPAPKGLMGLFGQIYVLDLGDTFGKFITQYRNEYFQPAGFMGKDWKLQPGAQKRIFKRVKPLVIRYGSDQLDMPPLTFLDRWVTLPKKARRLYDEMEEELIIKVEKGEIVAANSAVATGKCRQIANGGLFYNEKEKGYAHVHDEKCENLLELLEELNGEPAFVAYEFQHDMWRLQKFFKRYAKQFKDSPFVGGHTKDKEFKGIKRAWDRGDIPALFGQTSSVAYGLNMQGKGGIVVYFAMTWSLEDYEQFYQRVWRQGQERRVLAYRILAKNTVDEDMMWSIRHNDRNQQHMLRAMERRYHGFRQESRR